MYERPYGPFSLREQTGDDKFRGAIAMNRLVEKSRTNYLGQINFGIGKIMPPEGFSPSDFQEQVGTIMAKHLLPVGDFRQEYGSCSDGRGNKTDENGDPFPPRPKVIGAPPVFGLNIATIGNFSIINPDQSLAEKFRKVNERLYDAGFKSGMHHKCAAARSISVAPSNYLNNFDNIVPFMGAQTQELAALDSGRHMAQVKDGLAKTVDMYLGSNDDLSEEEMMDILRDINGKDARKAIIHLVTDPTHPTDGHEETGLIFLRLPNRKMDKPAAIESGIKVFYQNASYAEAIINALAQTEEERIRGLIIADQLPIATIATIGNHLHVGEIVDLAQAA